MPLRWWRRELLVKLETTYGTDAAPTGAANAILVSNATIEVEANNVDREIVRSTLGRIGSLRTMQRATVRGRVELAGSGTAGTAPKWSPIVCACGMVETVVTGALVQYRPNSNVYSSATAYWFADGMLHKIVGARGTCSLQLTPGQIPALDFTLTGLYQAPGDAALPVGTYTGWSTPVPPSYVGTPTCSLHGLALVAAEFSLDLGNEVVHRNIIGAEDVTIVRRRPRAEIVAEAVLPSVKNWHAIADAHTVGPLYIVHGTVAGNIVELFAPNAQILGVSYEERDGILYTRLSLGMCASQGDDDFALTVM